MNRAEVDELQNLDIFDQALKQDPLILRALVIESLILISIKKKEPIELVCNSLIEYLQENVEELADIKSYVEEMVI